MTMMRRAVLFAVLAAPALVPTVVTFGCGSDVSVFRTATGDGGAAEAASPTGTGGDWANAGAGGAGGNGGEPCLAQPDEDKDLDGWSLIDGDCNDCDPAVNPGAMEVATESTFPEHEPVDEDCDGAIDEPSETCDHDIALFDLDPMNGARAIELCKFAEGPGDWGVVGALYVSANGTPIVPSAQVRVLDGFGPNVAPRAGSRIPRPVVGPCAATRSARCV